MLSFLKFSSFVNYIDNISYFYSEQIFGHLFLRLLLCIFLFIWKI